MRKFGELLGRYIAAGTMTMMALAPEIPGALDAIKLLSQMGVIVSLGHSNATAAQAQERYRIGARRDRNCHDRRWRSFHRLRTLGVPFDSAVASMTFRPAALIGGPELGTITLGGRTTVV